MSFRATVAKRKSDKFSKKMRKHNFQWRQNLTRPYKSISSQKMSPRKIRTSDSHKSPRFPLVSDRGNAW